MVTEKLIIEEEEEEDEKEEEEGCTQIRFFDVFFKFHVSLKLARALVNGA